VVTKACTLAGGGGLVPANGEHLAVGAVLVSPSASLLAAITSAGGSYRAAVSPSVNMREVLGEAFAASNASE
jgi:hypothetical protein